MEGLPVASAQAILLVKTLEELRPDAVSPELRESAARAAGDPEDRAAFLTRRAEQVLARLPAKWSALARSELPPRWLWAAVAAAALVAGAATNGLGPEGRIHAFYNPLCLLIAWNLGVCVLLLARRRGPGVAAGGAARALARASTSVVARLWPARWLGTREAGDAEVAARFAQESQRALGALVSARAAALLGMGSVAFLAGAIAGIYLRGFAFGYNVVWRSTLVESPDTALRALHALFLPARVLAPGLFPDARAIASMASPDGTPAAAWIHALALTAVAYALVPRLLLLVGQIARARRLGREIALELPDEYWDGLLSPRRATLQRVDREVLGSFALDARALGVLASLQAGLIERDLRTRRTGLGRLRATLADRNQWYPEWRRVVERGWDDAFPDALRPRFLAWGSAELRDAVAATAQTRSPFAGELLAIELAAFEAYFPLAPVGGGLRRWIGLRRPPSLSDDARAAFFAEAEELLAIETGRVSGLRGDLERAARDLERFWLKLGAGVLAGVAVGGLTLGIAAPFVGGLVGGTLGLSGVAAVKAGLAALGGGSIAAGGLGVAGGKAVLVGGGALLGAGTAALSASRSVGESPWLRPGETLLAAAKLQVFLSKIVLGRQPELFRGVVERLGGVVDEQERVLRDLPLERGATERDVDDHEKALALLRRAHENLSRLAG